MLPSKIKLLEKEYSVIEATNNIYDWNENQLGHYVDSENLIFINLSQQRENMTITLFHELSHAYFSQTGDMQYFNDEVLCDKLALFMYSLIKHNDFSFMKEEG